MKQLKTVGGAKTFQQNPHPHLLILEGVMAVVINGRRLLRWSQVQQMVGLSKSTIWRMEREGQFPRRRLIGQRAVGWYTDEVQKWLSKARPETVRRRTDA